jgi:PAS domain S-box-containing protein
VSSSLDLLLVEDSQDDAELVLHALRGHGFDVASERVDTADALRSVIESRDWDVVICDHGLPSFDSTEALEIVREFAPDLPFVVLSGTIGEEAAVEALKSGASDVVLKTNLRRIGAVVERELRQAENQRARREAEAALRDSEERFRRLAENAPDIIFRQRIWPDVRLEYISPAVTEISGHTPSEHITNPELLRAIVHPEDLPLYDSAVGSPQASPLTIRWVREDGQLRWTETRSAAVYDVEGRLVAIEGIARDVTERKRADEDQARLEAQIAQTERLSLLGQLAGGVAHDFNTLLSVIGGYADRLRKRATDDPQREALDEILRATAHAAELTHDLLAFSRPTNRHGRPVDLNTVIEETDRLLRPLIEADVELVVSVADGLPRVIVDQPQLVRALVNLVVNARDATPSGGRITVETAEVELDETASLTPARRAGRYVAVRVTDTGHGITSEIRERLFQPFFTTKEAGRGTGLGLATVVAVVDDWGGAVEVESVPGNGARFTLYFPPASAFAEDEPQVALKAAPAAHEGETVLIAEDDASLRTLIELTLAEAGYQVTAAANGEDALAFAVGHADPIHLLITDTVMPKMGGVALIEHLWAVHPETRVLRVTGYNPGDQAVELSGLAMLMKPFGPDELLERVRETLDQSRAE